MKISDVARTKNFGLSETVELMSAVFSLIGYLTELYCTIRTVLSRSELG